MTDLLRNVGIVLAVLCLAVVLAFCAECAGGACGHAFCAGVAHFERSGAIVRGALAVHVAKLASARNLAPLRHSAGRLPAWAHLAPPSHFTVQAAPLRV